MTGGCGYASQLLLLALAQRRGFATVMRRGEPSEATESRTLGGVPAPIFAAALLEETPNLSENF